MRSRFGNAPVGACRVLKGLLPMLLVAFAVGGCGDFHCVSDPVPQFRLNGVTYQVFGDNHAARADLGRVVGKITAGLPSAATRCVSYTLKDGQGTPPVGANVYAINGVSESVALAVSEGGVTLRFDARRPEP